MVGSARGIAEKALNLKRKYLLNVVILVVWEFLAHFLSQNLLYQFDVLICLNILIGNANICR